MLQLLVECTHNDTVNSIDDSSKGGRLPRKQHIHVTDHSFLPFVALLMHQLNINMAGETNEDDNYALIYFY